MAKVVLSPHNVVNAADLGGHFWVYMQYAQALLRLGCEVYWFERFHPTGDDERDAAHLGSFGSRATTSISRPGRPSARPARCFPAAGCRGSTFRRRCAWRNGPTPSTL